jgi:small subunit ribosomal protein S6
LIIHNDIAEEQQDQMLQSIGEIIAKHKGSVLKTEKWGKKNFKYAIKKQSKGHYCFVVFEADVPVLKEIERSIMYNESILRYNFIRLEKFTAEPAPVAVAEPAAPAAGETPVEPKAEGSPEEEKVAVETEDPVEEQAAQTQE